MIKMTPFDALIHHAFDNRQQLHTLSAASLAELKAALTHIMAQLDAGVFRVCEKIDGHWQTNETIKKAILLTFPLSSNRMMGDSAPLAWYDKIAIKTDGWDEAQFQAANFRSVPGAFIRHSAYIAPGAILMPSFINVGARVGEGTLIDTWSTVGSCAQIGANCHISGGVGIGGVLEPVQATPVIIEDNCFIGARSEIAEGVIVEEGAVISMGVFLGASTKIVDRETGEVFYGRVPAYAVVVPGVMPSSAPKLPQLACAVIVKRVDERTRAKTSINDLLRV
jgi:2,3,4,5-tetrahydropyridine-2-carboxylate N-succinyltransferase